MACFSRRRSVTQSSDIRPRRRRSESSSWRDDSARRLESWRTRGASRTVESAAAPRRLDRRRRADPMSDPAPSGMPRQFGNAEANLRFIDETGVVAPGRDVLEIGTGTGALMHTLLERGCRVQGVEINQHLIAESRRWFGDLPVQIVTSTGLPFPAASFDIVLSFDVFEHI